MAVCDANSSYKRDINAQLYLPLYGNRVSGERHALHPFSKGAKSYDIMTCSVGIEGPAVRREGLFRKLIWGPISVLGTDHAAVSRGI